MPASSPTTTSPPPPLPPAKASWPPRCPTKYVRSAPLDGWPPNQIPSLRCRFPKVYPNHERSPPPPADPRPPPDKAAPTLWPLSTSGRCDPAILPAERGDFSGPPQPVSIFPETFRMPGHRSSATGDPSSLGPVGDKNPSAPQSAPDALLRRQKRPPPPPVSTPGLQGHPHSDRNHSARTPPSAQCTPRPPRRRSIRTPANRKKYLGRHAPSGPPVPPAKRVFHCGPSVPFAPPTGPKPTP